MKNLKVCFAGHRYEWMNIGIEKKLYCSIEQLILNGYNIFYNGDKGFFDKMCADIVRTFKHKYPQIKLIKILASYKRNEDLSSFDGSILPEIEMYYPKRKIYERNKWMVDNSDVLVCHVVDTYKSGAYYTLKYARKCNKKIIMI